MYGLNVCNSKHRDEYLLTIQGITSNSDVCYDILLKNEYKFCCNEKIDYDYRHDDLFIIFSKQNIPKKDL